MPKFVYKAKSSPEKIISGVVEAEDLDRAVKKVMELGYIPVDVNLQAKEKSERKEKADAKLAFLFKRRVPSALLVLFTRYMCDLVDASVPILRSIQLTSNQIHHPEFKSIINDVLTAVRDGSSFAEALEKHPDVFSKLYVNMVRSGEISGKLNVVLGRLAYLLEKEQETKGKVASSLAYPLLVLAVGFVTVFVLLTFIIPKVTVLFEDFNQDLPLVTVILLNISNFFASFWWAFVLMLGFGIFYFQRTLSTQKGRLWFDGFKLRLPLFGQFIQDVEVGRFSRILGTLLESGITIVAALNSVWAVLDNEILRQEIKKTSEEVTNGASLSLALKQCPHFPELAVSMISVGEETGFLERSLYKLAETYERQSENTVKTLLSLLGPAVLIIVVAIIGFFVVALMLPILRMNLVVS